RVVDEILSSKARPVIVVTGHQEEEVRAALKGRSVSFAHNPDFEEGMSTSLRVGVRAISEESEGAIICLGDMPLVRGRHLDALIRAFDPEGEATIYAPTYERKRGNPVLWARRHFAEVGALSGDVGARGLLEKYAERVFWVPVDDPGVTVDVDTPEALE